MRPLRIVSMACLLACIACSQNRNNAKTATNAKSEKSANRGGTAASTVLALVDAMSKSDLDKVFSLSYWDQVEFKKQTALVPEEAKAAVRTRLLEGFLERLGKDTGTSLRPLDFGEWLEYVVSGPKIEVLETRGPIGLQQSNLTMEELKLELEGNGPIRGGGQFLVFVKLTYNSPVGAPHILREGDGRLLKSAGLRFTLRGDGTNFLVKRAEVIQEMSQTWEGAPVRIVGGLSEPSNRRMTCRFTAPLPAGAGAYLEVAGRDRLVLQPLGNWSGTNPAYSTNFDPPKTDGTFVVSIQSSGGIIDAVKGSWPTPDERTPLQNWYPLFVRDEWLGVRMTAQPSGGYRYDRNQFAAFKNIGVAVARGKFDNFSGGKATMFYSPVYLLPSTQP
jgi:hypothetical protein